MTIWKILFLVKQVSREQTSTIQWALFYLTIGVTALCLKVVYINGIDSAAGGIIPMSDASGYYGGAINFIEFGELTPWTSRRPMASLFLALFLKICGGNLRIGLMLIAFFVGVSTYLFLRQVSRSHGTTIALIFLLLQTLFYKSFIGSTLSEGLGFCLGNIGFALLWKGVFKSSRLAVFLGIATITIGFTARPGALFILPGFVFFSLILSRSAKKRISDSLLIIIVVFFSLSINQILLNQFSHKDHLAYGNFSYVLYGIAAGGKGWKHVFEVHQLTGSDNERSKAAYKLAFQLIKENPMNFVKGLLNNWQASLNQEIYGSKFILKLVCIIIALALIPGILRLNISNLEIMFWIMSIGIFLSVPFLVDGGFRVYAVTFPILNAMVATGIANIGILVTRKNISPIKESSDILPELAALALIVVIVAGPFVLRFLSPNPLFANNSCPQDEQLIINRNDSGTNLIVASDNSGPNRYPYVEKRRLTKVLHSWHPTELSAFSSLQEGDDMRIVYDLLDKRTHILVQNNPLIANRSSYMKYCVGNNERKGKFVFYPSTEPIERLSNF